jgi:hypothetical protein
MSETAAFSYTPKINGDLFTIRGNTWAEFATNVDTILDNAQVVAEKLTQLSALANAAPLVNQATPPAPAPPPPAPAPPPPAPAANGWASTPAAAPAAAPPAAFAQAAVPQCAHGDRKPVAKANWKAWFCPTAQGAPDKCEPVFVSQKDDPAGWNNFPA